MKVKIKKVKTKIENALIFFDEQIIIGDDAEIKNVHFTRKHKFLKKFLLWYVRHF